MQGRGLDHLDSFPGLLPNSGKLTVISLLLYIYVFIFLTDKWRQQSAAGKLVSCTFTQMPSLSRY